MDYPYRSRVLDRLGVRSWLNARSWASVIGGTWIDDRVLEAMNEVAKTFVDMHQLFAMADQKVAELCQVDDAHITPGAGAAIELAVAGCIAGGDFGKWQKLPHTEGMKNEVVFPRGHYHAYAPQWKTPGALLVEYGQAGMLKSFKKELESAISEKTCCISYTVSYNNTPRGSIPLEEVISIGKSYDIPVVIDAASMLPPVSNLRAFTDMGADLVCFSGGKAIKGPSSTGMLLGCGKGKEIIQFIRDHTYPHAGWGRGHKISKEQIVGLVAALEIFVEEGDSLYDSQMETAKYLMGELSNIPHLEVTLVPNDETFHEHPVMPHVPRVLLQWDAAQLHLSPEKLDADMAREDPPIFLKERHYEDYYTNKAWRIIETFYLRPGEEKIVAQRLKRIFKGAR